jgi:hypothetical protein
MSATSLLGIWPASTRSSAALSEILLDSQKTQLDEQKIPTSSVEGEQAEVDLPGSMT